MPSSTQDPETYASQAGRLDLDYVHDTGIRIDKALSARPADLLPVAVSYQPGNGTAYDLVFVPVEPIRQLGTRVPVGCRGSGWERYVLVVKANLTDSASYSATFCARSAITALFRAICGVPILDAA